MKDKTCSQCLLIFKPLGLLTPEERLENHERLPHQIECSDCPYKFLSRTHLMLHEESFHRTRCGDCQGFCGSKCTMYMAEHMERDFKKAFNEGLLVKIGAAEVQYNKLEKFIMERVNLSTPLAMDMGRLLDSGFDTPESLNWSRLLYLPTAQYPVTTLPPRAKEWVDLTILEDLLIDHTDRIQAAGLDECPETSCGKVIFNNGHKCSNKPEASKQQKGPAIGDSSQIKSSVPKGGPGEEEESEMKKLNTGKRSPRTDEEDGKPAVANKDSLGLKAFACHQCSDKTGARDQRQRLVSGNTSQIENPVPEEETEEEEESEVKVVDMMKNSPQIDESNDKTKIIDIEFLEPIFKDTSLPDLIDSEEEDSENESEDEDMQHLGPIVGEGTETDKTGTRNQRQKLVSIEKPVPEEETEEEEESEVKVADMMKNSPQTDESDDETKTADVEFLEPLFKDTSLPDLTDSEEEDSEEESEDEDMQHLGLTVEEGNETDDSIKENTNASRNPSDEENEAPGQETSVSTNTDVKKIVIGYNEIEKICLPTTNIPTVVSQQFEVKFYSPGDRLTYINSEIQEDSKMKPQLGTESWYTRQTVRASEMTVISKGNHIKEVFLGGKAIPMEVDSCSIVSILVGHQIKDNLILEITKRTRIETLEHMQPEQNMGTIQHLAGTNLSDDPRRGGKRINDPRESQMKPNGASNPNIGKTQEEESESDTEHEFEDAASETHELMNWSNKDTESTCEENAAAPRNTADDSGFIEQGEHTAAASEINESNSLSEGDKDEYSSETDEEEYKSAEEENEECSSPEMSGEYIPPNDESKSNSTSGKYKDWPYSWDPIEDKYEYKDNYQAYSEIDSDSSTDGEEEGGLPPSKKTHQLSHWVPIKNKYEYKETLQTYSETSSESATDDEGNEDPPPSKSGKRLSYWDPVSNKYKYKKTLQTHTETVSESSTNSEGNEDPPPRKNGKRLSYWDPVSDRYKYKKTSQSYSVSDFDSSTDDEEEGSRPSSRNARRLSYWDPVSDKYKYKKTLQTQHETDSESTTDDEEENDLPPRKNAERLSYWDPVEDRYKDKVTHQNISGDESEEYDHSDDEIDHLLTEDMEQPYCWNPTDDEYEGKDNSPSDAKEICHESMQYGLEHQIYDPTNMWEGKDNSEEKGKATTTPPRDNRVRKEESSKKTMKINQGLLTRMLIMTLVVANYTSAKNIDGLILKNEIRNSQIPGSYGIDHEKIHEDNKKKIEDEVIKGYNCQNGGKASARISLTPPPKCNRADGSAYESPKMKRAQILEKVKKIPINVTICMVKFRVNVGYCGGEYAISSYTHNDIETLRDNIIPSAVQCNLAEPNGYLPITTPQYGSLQPLEIELKLKGGVGIGMFQPKGFSRPDSWCKGFPFLPPANKDDSIRYKNFKNFFEDKKMWSTEMIRRAIVTYRFSATVQKVQGYLINEGRKLVLPNTVVIERERDHRIENILDNSHYKSTGGRQNENELESYVDVSLGRIIFNRTNIPRHRCEEYKSIAKIETGGLYMSKVDNFGIYAFYRKSERVAVTLSQKIKECGRTFYMTGIPNVFVVLIEDHEPFLENEKLSNMENDENTMLEAEIRGTMNSIELSTDIIYMDINMRICQAQRQQIIHSQALLRRNMELMRDNNGRTLSSYTAGEVAMVQRCKSEEVKIREGETKCCQELPIWYGENFQKKGFLSPVSREVTGLCTPRVCSQFNSPMFNIGTHDDQIWVKVIGKEVIRTDDEPQEMIPESHNKGEQILTKTADIFTEQQKSEYEVFSLAENTRRMITEEIVNHIYPPEMLPSLTDNVVARETPNTFVSYNLQKAFLPWPINLIHLVPDWAILTVIAIIALLLFRVLFDPIMAICTLIRDSSLSLTQKISSIIVPATAITWMSRKKNRGIDAENIEEFELRVSELEDKMSFFSQVFVTEKGKRNQMRLQIANSD